MTLAVAQVCRCFPMYGGQAWPHWSWWITLLEVQKTKMFFMLNPTLQFLIIKLFSEKQTLLFQLSGNFISSLWHLWFWTVNDPFFKTPWSPDSCRFKKSLLENQTLFSNHFRVYKPHEAHLTSWWLCTETWYSLLFFFFFFLSRVQHKLGHRSGSEKSELKC